MSLLTGFKNALQATLLVGLPSAVPLPGQLTPVIGLGPELAVIHRRAGRQQSVHPNGRDQQHRRGRTELVNRGHQRGLLSLSLTTSGTNSSTNDDAEN
jgi:hypothetical protein